MWPKSCHLLHESLQRPLPIISLLQSAIVISYKRKSDAIALWQTQMWLHRTIKKQSKLFPTVYNVLHHLCPLPASPVSCFFSLPFIHHSFIHSISIYRVSIMCLLPAHPTYPLAAPQMLYALSSPYVAHSAQNTLPSLPISYLSFKNQLIQ